MQDMKMADQTTRHESAHVNMTDWTAMSWWLNTVCVGKIETCARLVSDYWSNVDSSLNWNVSWWAVLQVGTFAVWWQLLMIK